MSGAQTQHSSSLLDGDGVTEHLFHRLWEKDDLNLRPAIAIPDTIVIKNGKLQSWYFTAADGKIKRKTKKKLHLEQVEHVFVTRSVGYDVVATFIQTAELQGASRAAGRLTLDRKPTFYVCCVCCLRR